MAGDAARTLIRTLNAIHVGEISSIQSKLRMATRELCALGCDDLSEFVRDAGDKLCLGDVAGFKKLIAHVVSRLGHLS